MKSTFSTWLFFFDISMNQFSIQRHFGDEQRPGRILRDNKHKQDQGLHAQLESGQFLRNHLHRRQPHRVSGQWLHSPRMPGA